MHSDCRHLNKREIYSFPVDFIDVSRENKIQLHELCNTLMNDFEKNKYRKETKYESTGRVIYDEYYPRKSKPIIDQIDTVLARHYGFAEEELDFIIYYDIKYRMGRELDAYVNGELGDQEKKGN